jgi:peptide/nickel transport system ATP-binding protein
MTAPILVVEGLAKTYPGRPPVTVIRDIGFSIARGEAVGLVGESGSGKTTIGRALLRLIEPSAGRIVFDGQDLMALRPAALRAMRARMQYVFQDPTASLSPRMTVREILTEGLAIQGIGPAAERERRAGEALGQVELDAGALDRYPHEFSGGQRQRIGIARALALAPAFIVADEPVSALDVSVQAQMINLLRALRARLGLSMLFISHDLAVVEYLCDRVITLYLGRIMEIAPTDAAAAHPYTRALRDAVPDPDPAHRGTRHLLAGDIPSLANPPSGCVFRTRCPHVLPACGDAVPALRMVGPRQFSACIRDDIA